MSLGCTFEGAGDESSQRLYRRSLWIHKNERQCPRPVRRGPRRFGAPPPPAIPTSVTPTSGPVYVNRTGRRGGRGYTRSSKAPRWCPAPTDHGPWVGVVTRLSLGCPCREQTQGQAPACTSSSPQAGGSWEPRPHRARTRLGFITVQDRSELVGGQVRRPDGWGRLRGHHQGFCHTGDSPRHKIPAREVDGDRGVEDPEVSVSLIPARSGRRF